MRHDARSATHALSGFVDLLQADALGALSAEQRRALAHIQAAAERLTEITESAIELSDIKRPLHASETTATCLAHVTQQVLYAVSRRAPELNLSFAAADGIESLRVEVEHDALRRLLQILLDLVTASLPSQIDVRLSRTDLHASLVFSAYHEESSVLTAVPSHKPASTDLDAMASSFGNREYVRLKRCEALITRHKGRLLVTEDLARIRLMLPVG